MTNHMNRTMCVSIEDITNSFKNNFIAQSYIYDYIRIISQLAIPFLFLAFILDLQIRYVYQRNYSKYV